MTSFVKLLFIFLYAYFAVIDNEPLFVLNAKKKSCLLKENWYSLMDLVSQVAEQELHICEVLR